ncbi:DUF5405 family protein [Enterobacter sp.]|uniref:DUF5405 family protein n=1 Tax=Enterobacter sp. TaxID=42895 RepID=UPI00290A0DB8|nr:DUF5405 family protein [Enterobacter sp.]MDU7341790.1 DUF5405 family protein [Enterobacter sp.]
MADAMDLAQQREQEDRERHINNVDTIGYYPKINQLISGLIHHHIQTATINSLVEMAAEIERVGNLCTAAVRVA